ncbi:MAG: sulfatase [Armatimonadota bacterium]|nr:sulfatase [Armatimonadota bacterium]
MEKPSEHSRRFGTSDLSASNSRAMPRREFLKRSATAVAAVSILGGEALGAGGKRPPNIVLINCDDLGYGDLSCYGSKKIATPNVDAMARTGVKFSDFHSCAPVCTPSRAGLLTGRYPIRSGLTRVLGPGHRTGINDDEITLGEALKQRGYATAIIGKWHLGHEPRFLPMRHGFDCWYGIPYSNNMGGWKNGPDGCPLMRGEDVIEAPVDQDTLTLRYTEESIRFIREHRNGPFFLYLAHNMPHNPVHASERFRGSSKGKLYGDAVQEIDWGVGEILKTLKDLGLERNTLVMFTSDNGPNGGSAGCLRGGKTMVFEGGMRVPLVARWPGRIPAGHVCHEPASNMDLFTTCVTLAGGSVPADRPIDGRDIRPLFTVPGRNMEEYPFFYLRTSYLQAVRFGRWKMHVGRGTETLAKPELYDLDLDIGEKRDVAKDHPDIIADLQAKIASFMKGLPAEAGLGGSPESF